MLRHKVLSAVLAVIVLIVIVSLSNNGGNNASTTDASNTTTSGATKGTDTDPATPPTKSSTPAPKVQKPAVKTYGDGSYIVRKDIPVGSYRSSSKATCYWETLKGFSGDLNDIIANGNNSPAIVTLTKRVKGFQTEGCGHWEKLRPTFPSKPAHKFGDGSYIVGKDITPGLYRASGGGNCYWARVSSFAGGGIHGILANGNTAGLVQLKPTDLGFTTYGCGTWTK